ncbi:MAG TPA: response regulator, partial [Polyangia bacterium]
MELGVAAQKHAKDSELPATVLVVDDDQVVLSLLVRALEQKFDVIPCRTATDALARVRQGGFEAVVSDINMPGMNGIELLRAVREHDPDLPVLLVTGLPSWEGAAEAIELGVFRYLPKPFDIEQLRGTVMQATQLCRLARL